jgi:hypothetical protein
MNLDLSLQLVVFRITAAVLLFTVQGLAIAAIAVLLGDRGPRYDGRMTLSPAAHVDLVGLLALVLSGLGWGRSVAVDGRELRPGPWALVLVALTGGLVLLAAAPILLLLVPPALELLPFSAGLATAAFLRLAAETAVWNGLLALVPIPPLAAGLVLTGAGITIAPKLRALLVALAFAVLVTGLARPVLAPAQQIVAPFLLPDWALR